MNARCTCSYTIIIIDLTCLANHFTCKVRLIPIYQAPQLIGYLSWSVTNCNLCCKLELTASSTIITTIFQMYKIVLRVIPDSFIYHFWHPFRRAWPFGAKRKSVPTVCTCRDFRSDQEVSSHDLICSHFKQSCRLRHGYEFSSIWYEWYYGK